MSPDLEPRNAAEEAHPWEPPVFEPDHDRVNALANEATECGAALRWRLNREECAAYDAVTTARTPGKAPGVPYEIKACSVWIENGDPYGTHGRIAITRSSHERLEELGGWCAIAVYRQIEHAGEERIVVYGWIRLPAGAIGALYPEDNGDVHRIPWPELFDELPSSAWRGIR